MTNLRRTLEAIFAAGVSAALTLGYIIFVGRALGPIEYADFSASLSLIYLFAVALTPITPTLSRIVAMLAVRENWAAIRGVRGDVMHRAGMWLGGFAIVGLAVSPLLARVFKFQSPITFSLAIVAALFFALLSIDRGVLQGLMRFRQYNLNILIESSVRCFGAILLFIVIRKSTNLALASYVVAIVIAEATLSLRLRREWRTTERQPADWKQISRLALPMFGLMICVAIFQNVDMLAVKRWLTPAESGLYGAATALAKGFGVLFVPLYVLSGPILSALHESQRRLLGTILRFEAWFLALCAVPLFLYAVLPDAILRLLYGEAFMGAAPLLLPLAGISIITHSALMFAQLLITVHDFRFLRVYAVMCAAQIVGLIIFHQSVGQILTVLYVCQSVVLVTVIAMILFDHAQPRHE